MSIEHVFSELNEISGNHLKDLTQLLVDVVEEGASVGFLPPLSQADAIEYWSGVVSDDLILWVVQLNGEIVGSVQLHLCSRPNGIHRAEIAKLVVHPRARRKGIGRSLMTVAEERARIENRSLVVLDTRAGDPSNLLYLSLQYTEAGRIPQYAQSADGDLHETVFYYKCLLPLSQ
jgi:ribosomal protein S18 acetylase RimI-like enzyme